MFEYWNLVMEIKLMVLNAIKNVSNWYVFLLLCFIHIIFLIASCSGWCVLVEEQEDICLCTWWSNCSIRLFWAARVPLDYLGLPHFYFGPCNHVPMVQCVNLHQQVSVMLYLSLVMIILVLGIDRQVWTQVSSSHTWSSTSRRSVSSDCCWVKDWN